jgi:hypothetical protein
MREVYGFYLFNKYFKFNKHKLVFAWSRFGKIAITLFNIIKIRNLQSLKELVNLFNALFFVFLNKNEIKNGDLSKFNKKFNYEI